MKRVLDPKGREIAVTVDVPRELEIDFLQYRSATYFKPMTSGVAEELALWLTRKNRPVQADVETLGQMFLNSGGALMTRWSEDE